MPAQPGSFVHRRVLLRRRQTLWFNPPAPLPLGAPPGGLVINRRPARSFYGGVQAFSNTPPIAGTAGTAPHHLVIGRRASARGVYGGHAVPPQVGVPVVDGLVRRRQAVRVVWRGIVTSTTNAAPAGAVAGNQPRGFISSRRGGGGLWGGAYTPTPNLQPGNQPGSGLVKRRRSARAFWRGFVSTTTNATPATPINGTAPDHLVVARRSAGRAVWAGTVTRTVNATPGQAVNGTVPPHLVVARRTAGRAVWDGVAVPPRVGKPGTGGLVRRRTGARGVWYGRPVRTANAVPAAGTAPDHLVVARRAVARGQWRGYVSRTTNAPPPPFTVGQLTTADRALGVLTAGTASGSSGGGILTATDQRTGGPG